MQEHTNASTSNTQTQAPRWRPPKPGAPCEWASTHELHRVLSQSVGVLSTDVSLYVPICPYMSLYVCLLCMPLLSAGVYVYFICMPYMYALYVCLICMPSMYAFVECGPIAAEKILHIRHTYKAHI